MWRKYCDELKKYERYHKSANCVVEYYHLKQAKLLVKPQTNNLYFLSTKRIRDGDLNFVFLTVSITII